MEDLLIEIGDNIKCIRNAKGYTQEELGDIAGISKAHIRNIENGKNATTIILLYEIATALDVPMARILPNYRS